LTQFDLDHFEERYADYKWLESKSGVKKSSSTALTSSDSSQGGLTKDEAKSIQIVKGIISGLDVRNPICV